MEGRIIRNIATVLLLVVAVSSCRMVRNTMLSSDRKLAKIGRDVLYENEVTRLVPFGASPQDSAAMIQQYINTWALDKLLLMRAEERLSKSDRDISDEIEKYRSNLLGFRYEKKYIEDRIDTVITEEQVKMYYNANSDAYRYPFALVKARVVKISVQSPYYDAIREGITVVDPREFASTEEMCFSSSEKYTNFNNEWISIDALAKEVGMPSETLLTEIMTNRFLEINNGGDISVMISILDFTPEGELAPFGYCEERIRETLLTKRKQKLSLDLEQELLNEALSNNVLKIYDYHE